MPKMKTNKSVAKRLKVTGRGKLLRYRTGAGHLKSNKPQERIRRLRKQTDVDPAFDRHARRLLGIPHAR